MGRPRTPTNILALKGSFKKNPKRLKARENEPVNKNPIGKPPAWLTALEKKAWRILVKDSIHGVLGEADRTWLELACELYAKKIEGTLKSIERSQLMTLLGRMGLNPSDRSRVSVPVPKKKNRFDDDDDW